MHDQHLAFTTPVAAPTWKRRMIYSPVARIVIFFVMTVLITVGLYLSFRQLGWTAKDAAPSSFGWAEFVLMALAPLIAYLVLVKFIERRPIDELARDKWIPGGVAGFATGFAMVSTTVGVLALFGSYHVIRISTDMNWLGWLTLIGLAAAIGEEFIYRGVLFRIVEEGIGTVWALGTSALLFGVVHLGNEGATLWSSIAIAVNAGLMLGLVYHLTRSIPACIGLHAAWNFFQGPFYGAPVSGYKEDGWIVSTLSGPEILTGGAFGLEASVVMVVVCSLITLTLLLIALRRRSLVPCRPWQRLLHRKR